MNRYAALGCLGLGLMLSPMLGSAIGAVPTAKVAIVDLSRTLRETPAGKRATDQFEKIRKDKQSELDKRQTDLKKAEAEMAKKASMLKPETLQQQRADLEKKFVELQQLYVKLERDLAQEQAKLLQDILKKATPIIQQIAKAEGVSLVIDQNAIVWAEPSVDITEKLNAKML